MPLNDCIFTLVRRHCFYRFRVSRMEFLMTQMLFAGTGDDESGSHEPQHARFTCPLPAPRAYSNTCPLCQWCHPTISSSVIPFSSCLQPFPASGSSQMSQLFTSGGRSIGVSASTSVLPMNTQDWSPLGWTGWISLQSKGLSRVFSNTTVQKHQFFCTQLSLESNSYIHTWPNCINLKFWKQIILKTK